MNYQEIKKKFGTPCYIYDEEKVIKQMNDYVDNFKSDNYETKVLYASKACCISYLHELAIKHGLGLDVVSGGEIMTYINSGARTNDVYFHGNNKTHEEIVLALSSGVNHFIVDNLMELEELDEVARTMKKKVEVLVRLNLGIEAHTHKYIMTSYTDSKFGIIYDSFEFEKMDQLIKKSDNLVLEGFHSHIGSQILDMEGFYQAIEKLVNIVKSRDEELSLNIGGGYGIKYLSTDEAIPVPKLCKMLIEKIDSCIAKNGVKLKRVLIEPGRSIVGEAGSTLYTIGNMKVTPNRKYLFVDGGMSDNIRPSLYEAIYEAEVLNDSKEQEEVTVAGKLCETGDILIDKIKMNKANKGDLLLVKSTGAYGYSMASNYNRLVIPPVIFVNQDDYFVAIKKQSYLDMLRLDEVK